MKWIILVISLATLAAAADVDIDWSKVRPAWQLSNLWNHNSVSNNPSNRIVGGELAEPGQFPYKVAVLSDFPSGRGLCGGSIVSENCVLTAAHCVKLEEDATGGVLVMGAHNLTDQNEKHQRRIPFTKNGIFVHSDWDMSLLRNDIAMICVKSRFEFNTDRIRMIDLPKSTDENFVGQIGTVSGFGVFSDADRVTSDVPRFVSNPIMTNRDCNIRFLGVIQSTHICKAGTGGRGGCNGDSGGPLTIQRDGKSLHVGIASFVLALGCERGWPTVFTRTSSYLDWIHEKTQNMAL